MIEVNLVLHFPEECRDLLNMEDATMLAFPVMPDEHCSLRLIVDALRENLCFHSHALLTMQQAMAADGTADEVTGNLVKVMLLNSQIAHNLFESLSTLLALSVAGSVHRQAIAQSQGRLQ